MSEEIKGKLWARKDVADFLNVSTVAANKIVKYEDFPSPIYLWEGANEKWLEDEVRNWVKTRRG